MGVVLALILAGVVVVVVVLVIVIGRKRKGKMKVCCGNSLLLCVSLHSKSTPAACLHFYALPPGLLAVAPGLSVSLSSSVHCFIGLSCIA